MRSVLSLTEVQKSGLGEVKFDLGVANHPEKGLFEGSLVQRQEEIVLDTKACVVFLMTGKMSKTPFTAKAWIEKGTGLPSKVDYTFDSSHLPMTKSLTYSVVYARSSEGLWLPKQVTIDLVISVLFRKIRTTVRQNLDVWITRP